MAAGLPPAVVALAAQQQTLQKPRVAFAARLAVLLRQAPLLQDVLQPLLGQVVVELRRFQADRPALALDREPVEARLLRSELEEGRLALAAGGQQVECRAGPD